MFIRTIMATGSQDVFTSAEMEKWIADGVRYGFDVSKDDLASFEFAE